MSASSPKKEGVTLLFPLLKKPEQANKKNAVKRSAIATAEIIANLFPAFILPPSPRLKARPPNKESTIICRKLQYLVVKKVIFGMF